MNKHILLTLLLTFFSLGLAAQSSQPEGSSEVELKPCTWPIQQFQMKVPPCKVVAENDSCTTLEGDGFVVNIFVEDRSSVTEEDCAKWCLDRLSAVGEKFDSCKFGYAFGKRSVGAWYVVPYYPPGDDHRRVAGSYCGIDRFSRRIYTVMVYADSYYEPWMQDIVKSVDVIDEPYKY